MSKRADDLRAVRLEKRLTQEEVASKFKVSQGYYSAIERGQKPNEIAEALKVVSRMRTRTDPYRRRRTEGGKAKIEQLVRMAQAPKENAVTLITKLDAANRQLCAAIHLFFADGDAVAVHTLACAAREIYEKNCLKTGRTRMFDFVRSGNPEHAERDLWNVLNAARNFFKHEGSSLSESIEFEELDERFCAAHRMH